MQFETPTYPQENTDPALKPATAAGASAPRQGARGQNGAGRRPAPGPGRAGVSPRLLGLVSAVAALSIIANFLIYSRLTTLRPLATVGGHVISKREYLAVLEEDSGKRVLSKLVFDELVRQAAIRDGLVPTQAEIEARVAAFDRLNPGLARSVPEYRVRSDVQTGLELENLRIQHVPATDAEALAYYRGHQQDFLDPGELRVTMVVAGRPADAQTAADLLRQSIAPEVIARQPSLRLVGDNGFTFGLDAPGRRPVIQQMMRMRPGQIQTLPVGGQYLVVKNFSSRPPGEKPFEAVKPDVVRLVRLAKAPSVAAELKALYRAERPSFDIDKYAADFTDFESSAAAVSAPAGK